MFGEVFVRGHVGLFPIPQQGGGMLTTLPRVNDQCYCTPQTIDVIGTTTALAYPNASSPTTGINPDVCIVRLLFTSSCPADVNQDGVINELDTQAIEANPQFVGNPGAPSNCTGSNPLDPCGRADVNQDGRVNPSDTIAVTNSASFGTDVRCGCLWARSWSCGSSRTNPLVPAIGVSLDAIQFLDQPGVTQSKRKRETDTIIERLEDHAQSLSSHAQHLSSLDGVVKSLQSREMSSRLLPWGFMFSFALAAAFGAFFIATRREKQ